MAVKALGLLVPSMARWVPLSNWIDGANMNSLGVGFRVLMTVSRYNLVRWLRKERLTSEKRIDTIVSEIRKRSYVVIPSYLSAAECVRITQDIDRSVESYPDCVQIDKFGSDHRIFGSEHGSRAIMAFHNDKFALTVGACYGRHSLRNFATLAGRLEMQPSNAGSGQGWHRDSLNRQFKAIVYLTDVNDDSGPFQIDSIEAVG